MKHSKIFALLVGVLMLICIRQPVEAANTTYSTATKISVNSTYSDNLTSSSDVNWYKFTVSGAGYISLTFTHDYIESGRNYWKAYLCNENQKELSSYSFAGNTTSYTEGNIGLPAGTYYLKITNDYYYSDKNYKIKINYTSSNAWEGEFNDSYSEANSISVNNTYNGSIRMGGDADWYKFKISGEGYISLEFTHDYIESGRTYWKAYLYDANQKELSSYSFVGNTTSYAEGNIGLPAGTYYLKITNDYYYSNQNYKIKINYTSSNAWESEFNDSYSEADSISVNNTYNGSMRMGGDADWYKFKISGKGYISLEFTHDYIESGNIYWRAHLYDTDQKELSSYSFAGNTTSYTQGNIGLPAGTYYLKITNDYYYSDKNYTIKINYTASNAWESELNDSYSTADSIGINNTYYGSMKNSSDADWYKLTVPSGGTHILSFRHDYVASGSTYWQLYLYNSSMTELESYSYKGDTTSSNELLNLSAGTYYIKIRPYSYSDGTYNFVISPHTHSYKNTVTKATTSQNGKVVRTCSCGMTSGTTTIYYPSSISLSSTKYAYNGKVRKPSVIVKDSDGKTISSSNYTLTYSAGRKNVGKYKVKISFKGNYSGSVSKTFVINPKATKISKLKSRSRGFTVKWKKQTKQVTGYQIQYSSNVYFSGKTTKTISRKNVSSATYKKLWSNCRYYVKIRTYKTVAGKKYYSSWSKAKTIRTK